MLVDASVNVRSCAMVHVKIRVRDAHSHAQVVVHNVQKHALRIVHLLVTRDARQDVHSHALEQKKLLLWQPKFKLEVINYVRMHKCDLRRKVC